MKTFTADVVEIIEGTGQSSNIILSFAEDDGVS